MILGIFCYIVYVEKIQLMLHLFYNLLYSLGFLPIRLCYNCNYLVKLIILLDYKEERGNYMRNTLALELFKGIS